MAVDTIYTEVQADELYSPSSAILYQMVDGPIVNVIDPAYHLLVNMQGMVTSKGIQCGLWFRTDNLANKTASQLAISLGALVSLNIQSSWLDVLSNAYTLVRKAIEVFSPAFAPQLSQPYISPVGLPGTMVRALSGRAQTLNMGFVLNVDSLAGLGAERLPKRSRIAFGPVAESAIDNSGNLVLADWGSGDLSAFTNSLLQPLVDVDGNTFAPERVTVKDAQGYRYSAEISGIEIKARASFRRSRNNG